MTENAIFQEGFTDALFNNLIVGIVPVVVLIIFFVVAVKLAGRRRKGDVRQKTEDMLNNDNNANMARNKAIGEEFFYTQDMAALPIANYTEEEMKTPVPTYMWQKKIVALAEKKMLHFDRQYSNVELKQMYGASNLEAVARYEENFTNFIHTMRNWAEALITAGKTADAQKVLEASVAARSELSQSYTLLADIYAGDGDFAALSKLRVSVEAGTLPGKGIALKHIDKLAKEAR